MSMFSFLREDTKLVPNIEYGGLTDEMFEHYKFQAMSDYNKLIRMTEFADLLESRLRELDSDYKIKIKNPHNITSRP